MTRPAAALTVASIALAMDMLVYGLAVPILPTIARAQGAPPAAIGLLFASYAAALLLATPVVGRWVDRAGPRTPLLVGLVGLAAATLLFAVAGAFPLLVLARALQGVSAAVSWTAGLGLIAATHPPEARGRAMGLALSSIGAGTLLGPPVGGFLFEHGGMRLPFLVAAALVAADGIARWVLVRDVPAYARGASLAAVARRPQASRVITLTALGAALLAFFEPILPLHLARDLGIRPGGVGLLFGLAVLVGALTAPLGGLLADRLPPIIVAVTGTLIGAVAVAALGWTPSLWGVGLTLAVIAGAGSLILAPTLSLIAEVAEAQAPPAYGAAYALYNLAYAVGLTAAPLLGGLVFGATNFQGATLAGGGVLALAGLAVGLAWRRSLAPLSRITAPPQGTSG